ncbi:MAG TPA: MBL fold metallo-hydrolase [Burkholderiales bacterium]|nr:MBL fold metallo-hydrolase [Burkholderiales bacterium]
MRTLIYLLALAAAPAALPAMAQNVRITPLGSHDGELCAFDRALIFEDPDGTRVLYDAGRTVRGADDPRLGKIDAVLLTHVHGDHIGDSHSPSANAGSCAAPDVSISDTPNSNTVNVVMGKAAPLVVGGEMHFFFQQKVKSLGGDPAKLVRLARFGAGVAIGKVQVISVPAAHTNGLPPAFLDKGQAELLAANGLTAYVGPPGGFVVRFSNGLVAYLSGDTGITTDQQMVGAYYKPNLAVMSIGGNPNMTGPQEAGFVMNEYVRPASVIATHVNEAATQGGKVLPNTKTAAFQKAAKMPVYVPLSGKTMEFDGSGHCRAGC